MKAQMLRPGVQCSSTSSDIQCSGNNYCGPTSLRDIWQHPDWLFAPNRTPVIHIGSVSFPGPFLPATISAVFIYTLVARLRSRRNQELDVRRLPPVPDQDNGQWPDLRDPMAASVYFGKATTAFHAVVTTGAFMHFGRSFLETPTLCCCQVAALLLHGEFVRPAARKPCLATATGWTLFAFLDHLPEAFSKTAACGIIILLTASLKWHVGGTRSILDYQQSGSGMLLMLMAANKVLFSTPMAAHEWAKEHPWGVASCINALLVTNVCMIAAFNRDNERRHPTGGLILQEFFTAVTRIFPGLLRLTCLVVAFLLPLAGGIICTAYMCSCLPWQGLLFGKCASSPSLSKLSIVATYFIYTTTWLAMMNIEQEIHPRNASRGPRALLWAHLRLNGDALGWSCTFLILLYLGLSTLV